MRVPVEVPPGIFSDDTTFAKAGRWSDANNVRFVDGQWQPIGGWELLVSTALTGICRAILPWTKNVGGALNIAFGTHSKLQLWLGGELFDITPFGPPNRLAAAPLSVANTSAVVTVTHAGHGYSTGQEIKVAGAVAVGGITPNGGPFAITVVDANTYTYTFSSPATSDATGGGSLVVVTPQTELPAGAVDGTGSAGFGTGAFGTGLFGRASDAEYFPRTWSLAPWGQQLLANPRGGGIFLWENDTAVRAAVLANAPTQVTQMLVAHTDQVFALGCEEEVSGALNPLCIRHSGVRKNTVWHTAADTTSREYILTGGGRIVGGRLVGPYMLVWTTHALFVGTYVGSPSQVWRFDRVGDKCGLAGPNAAVVVGQTAYWVTPDLQFRSYSLGGAVQPIVCPIRKDFAENMAPSQWDKISASSISAFSEVRFEYPDSRDGNECSRYLSLNLLDGAWSRGQMARPAMVDAGPQQYPIGVDPSGNVYWHEKGASANGSAFAWHIASGDLYLDPDVTALVRGAWPDIADQVGAISMTLYSRLKPQGDERTFGPRSLSPGQGKADFRANGRLFRFKFSGDTAPTAARGGRTVFDIRKRGRR